MPGKKLNGTDVLLSIWNTTAAPAAWQPIASLTEQSLERTANEIDVTGKEDGGSSASLVGRKERSISFSGYAIAVPAVGKIGYDYLETLFDNSTEFEWRLAPVSGTEYTPRFGFGVLLGLNETASDNEGVQFEANMKINGTPVKVNPHP